MHSCIGILVCECVCVCVCVCVRARARVCLCMFVCVHACGHGLEYIQGTLRLRPTASRNPSKCGGLICSHMRMTICHAYTHAPQVQLEFLAWIVSMCFVAISLPVSFYHIFLHFHFYRLFMNSNRPQIQNFARASLWDVHACKHVLVRVRLHADIIVCRVPCLHGDIVIDRRYHAIVAALQHLATYLTIYSPTACPSCAWEWVSVCASLCIARVGRRCRCTTSKLSHLFRFTASRFVLTLHLDNGPVFNRAPLWGELFLCLRLT